ncbi:hypothetical protein OG723_44320 (plasmid) [Streptomyces sp. NBC_01278]|uniref:hypothetical protein n=1 Tax=Streptomyces sp. NBC_01278 TaxID=2903809 RepID=UPI002E3208FE|nr:hypothetical protein [Streptomyces sp. NBC_01278]
MLTPVKLRTITTSLLLACSVAALGAAAANSAPSDLVVADSAWGFAPVEPTPGTSEEPAQDAPPVITPRDSAWG